MIPALVGAMSRLTAATAWASERRAVRQHAGNRERQSWKSRWVACVSTSPIQLVNNSRRRRETQSFDDHVWQFEDGLSWTHGRHNFKFGGQLSRQIIKTFYAGNNGQLGLMDFDGRFTSIAHW